MPELHDPLPSRWRSLARRAVLDHARGERRRSHPPLLHVGVPGGVVVVVPASEADGEAPFDHALRVDVLAAALHRLSTTGADDGAPLVWLTRSGEVDLQDLDAAWVAAATTATAEAGLDLTLVVVNRHGWRDPRSGVAVSWRRLRSR